MALKSRNTVVSNEEQTMAQKGLFLCLLLAFSLRESPALSATINAPSNLTVLAVSQTIVNLSWADNSNNETNFEIYRRMWSRGSFLIIKTLPANTTAYSDVSVVEGITYYYRVRAINTLGHSNYSNIDYDSTALVTEGQITTATEFGMPFGEELKNDLSKLSVNTCPNNPYNYPKIRFNDDGNDSRPSNNEWYVATAFDQNRYVDRQCNDLGWYQGKADDPDPNHHDYHPGEDWNATGGDNGTKGVSGDKRAPLYAIATGVVIFNSGECKSNGADATSKCNNTLPTYKGGFGNTLIILHRTANQEYILSVYAHLADPPLLPEGSQVNVGDPIGYIGSTGYKSVNGILDCFHIC